MNYHRVFFTLWGGKVTNKYLHGKDNIRICVTFFSNPDNVCHDISQ